MCKNFLVRSPWDAAAGHCDRDACGPLCNQGAQVSIAPRGDRQLSSPRPLPPHSPIGGAAGQASTVHRGETGLFRGACGCDLHEQIMRGPAACRGEWAGSLPLPSPPLPGPSLLCPANAWLCPGAVGSPSMAASWGRVLLHRQVQGLRGAQMGVGSPDEAAGASCPPRANPPGTWWAPAPPAGTSFRRLALDGVQPPAPWHLRLLTRRVTAARGCHLSRPFPGALTFGETGGLSRPRSHRVRGPGVPVTDSTGLGPPDAACGEQRATRRSALRADSLPPQTRCHSRCLRASDSRDGRPFSWLPDSFG